MASRILSAAVPKPLSNCPRMNKPLGGFAPLVVISLLGATLLLHGCSGSSNNSSSTNNPTGTPGVYYLSPTGNDSNSGTSLDAAWLSPNHSLSCGNVIMAAASTTYSAANFNTGKWGTVNCPAGNNVAWLTCTTFDACKIDETSGTEQAMAVDQSYWGVAGWEASTAPSVTYGACFSVSPSGSSTVHHVIFANNIANGCASGGFTAYAKSSTASVDYIAFIGNIAYNAAQGTNVCGSGFNVGEPLASDTNTGTHIYVAGNFSWANVDGDPCAGQAPTDGEGINLDTWDMSHSGGTPYTQQGVVTNNVVFLNGGYGIEIEHNAVGSAHAPIFITNNTLYGDRRDMSQQFCIGNGDLHLYAADNVTTTGNLIYSGYAADCGGNPFYAIAIGAGNATDSVANTWFSGVDGNNDYLSEDGSFALGTGNTIGTNPMFANPVNPGPPNCGAYTNVPACMATVIANFTPAVAAAKSYGYQQPATANAKDPFFPQWLCSADIPSGLITMSCAVGASFRHAQLQESSRPGSFLGFAGWADPTANNPFKRCNFAGNFTDIWRRRSLKPAV